MDILENPNLDNNLAIHPWEKSRASFICKIIKNYNKINMNYILDYGSGDTYVLSRLQKNDNKNFIALDKNYNKEHIKILQKRYDTDYIINDLNALDINNSDLLVSHILLLDVLEHIKKPEKTLSEIYHYKLIADDAIFIITVPAFQSLFTKHDSELGHYRRYSINELRNLVIKENLKILESGHLFHTALFLRLIEKIAEKLFGYDNRNKIQNSFSNKLINKFFYNFLKIENNLFYFLRHNFRINIPGLTTYIICQK